MYKKKNYYHSTVQWIEKALTHVPGGKLKLRSIKQTTVNVDREYFEQIDRARADLQDIIICYGCAADMIQLAWFDAATFDKLTMTGGPRGAIRFEEEYSSITGANLKEAIDQCETLKLEYGMLTYADLYQLAGVVAVEVAGGPKITFTPGRTESTCARREWRRLPINTGDADFMRYTFSRMGFNDEEIVALSAIRAMGNQYRKLLLGIISEDDVKKIPLKFDNSFFVALNKPEFGGLLKVPEMRVLIDDPKFHKYVEKFAQDIKYFFESYASAHKKFSELGYVRVPQRIRVTYSMILLILVGIALLALVYFFYMKAVKIKYRRRSFEF